MQTSTVIAPDIKYMIPIFVSVLVPIIDLVVRRYKSRSSKTILWAIIIILVLSGIIYYLVNRNAGIDVNTIAAIAMPIIYCSVVLICKPLTAQSTALELKPDELEKKINEFTKSHNSPLKMILGDMDFLGEVVPDEMSEHSVFEDEKKNQINNNSQLNVIDNDKINNIKIICHYPLDDKGKARIGYLKSRFENRIKIRFIHDSDETDSKNPGIKIRGRIMGSSGGHGIVITNKIIKHKLYEYIEFNSSTWQCTLFSDLWNVAWAYANEDENLLKQCSEAYNSEKAKH
jgi:hypothetical protein